ncbi:leucine-rich repeat receptor-like serine/threonine-protein kinase SKM1 isoform X2 [Humulus lupulus]|nr:leucine-rich repeat receptor-like serine/threonine-protein kinase SKM1 isoform X2 [Humulus lupulus]
MIMESNRSSAQTTHPTLFIFMSLILFSTSISALHGDDELDLLLSFKASINDPFNHLSDWSSSSSSAANNVCQWQGLTCNNSSRVNSIDLTGKNFTGKLSATIFRLPAIETVDLSGNQLRGELPEDLFGGSNMLRYLNLSSNNFTGPIPSGAISTLETLDLSNNMLKGTIPEDIGSFYRLTYLDLGGNVLVGAIPKSLSNISGLQYLTLASNQLSGEIPQNLMKTLKLIYLGYNNLSGEIPSQIGDLKNLYHLDLVYNNLTGTIPYSIGNLTQLRYLFLYQNKLTGPIPRSVFELRRLVSLDLSDNFLEREIPEAVSQLRDLEILHLFSNKLTGTVPSGLASLPRLQVLQLWSNELSGEIPRDLGKRNNLTVLDLSTNRLSGRIPDGLCDSGRLFKLILFSNSFQGIIPKRLTQCKSLRRVRLQNNLLSGELSPELAKFPLVYFLDISGNNISGRIDSLEWNMPSLQMLNLARNQFFGKFPESFGSEKLENLVLSDNHLSGEIPTSFENFSRLMQLDLSYNKLSGQIPGELALCERMVSLDLSHNQLIGEIPASITEMPVLGFLDLSDNQLSGEIPRNLGQVESLVQVNVSHNHFHGSLPPTGAFLAINASSVDGNELCGGEIVTSGLLPCEKSIKKHFTWRLFLTCFFISLTALAIVISVVFVLVIIHRKRKDLELKRVENDDGSVWEVQFFDSNIAKSVTLNDVVSSAKRGNNVLNSLGRRRGITYKGKSSINSTEFVVKEVNDINYSVIGSNFWLDVKGFGKIRHPNVIKLMGVCRSSQKAGGYVVYEYCEGKLVSEVLRSLSWERRRKIAIGVAQALRFLHCYCSPNVVVGHVSPDEIVVDNNDEPRLSLNLPGLLLCSSNSKGFTSSAYVAPEASKGVVTEKSDVYGFGLVLIELLTGKSPADTEFGVHETFVEWARYCYSDCHLDTWIDPLIGGHVSTHQNQIVETMNLALHCTAYDPTARPCANDLYKTLDTVVRTGSCVSGLKVLSSLLY